MPRRGILHDLSVRFYFFIILNNVFNCISVESCFKGSKKSPFPATQQEKSSLGGEYFLDCYIHRVQQNVILH